MNMIFSCPPLQTERSTVFDISVLFQICKTTIYLTRRQKSIFNVQISKKGYLFVRHCALGLGLGITPERFRLIGTYVLGRVGK